MPGWWSERSRMERVLLVVAVIAAIVHIGILAERRARKVGDFDVHREFGRRFLEHEPLYAGGLCFNYMPVSAAMHAPLALVHQSISSSIRYLVAIGCLVAMLRMLATMTRPAFPEARWHPFAVAALTVLFGLHYIVRDLDDAGPHLILAAMAVAGMYWAWRGRELIAGAWFGLAIALKMTPGLFIPFFLWKRRYALAFYSTAATCVWIVLPAVWMGAEPWWNHQQQWNRMALGIAANVEDPARISNEARVQNQALKPAIMQYLQRYPDDHSLTAPGFRDITGFALSEKTADRLANAAVAVLLAICAWRSRQAYCSAQDPRWLLETSGVLVLTVLLSPVTWLQHLVFLLPALYLLAGGYKRGERWPAAAWWAIGFYAVLSMVLNREIVGRDNYLLLLSLQSHTACMLIVLGLLLWLQPTVAPLAERAQTNEAPSARANRAAA